MRWCRQPRVWPGRRSGRAAGKSRKAGRRQVAYLCRPHRPDAGSRYRQRPRLDIGQGRGGQRHRRHAGRDRYRGRFSTAHLAGGADDQGMAGLLSPRRRPADRQGVPAPSAPPLPAVTGGPDRCCPAGPTRARRPGTRTTSFRLAPRPASPAGLGTEVGHPPHPRAVHPGRTRPLNPELRGNLRRWPGGRLKVPTILQMEATECGVACLAMILAHHGRWGLARGAAHPMRRVAGRRERGKHRSRGARVRPGREGASPTRGRRCSSFPSR